MRTLPAIARKPRWLRTASVAAAAVMACAPAIPAMAAPQPDGRGTLAVSPAAPAVTVAQPHGGVAVGRAPSRAELAAQAVRQDETAASLRAKTTRKSVVVSAETSTGTLVTANPNGSFTLTETSQPVRVKQHGVWVPVNPDLIRGPGGTLRAAATATGVWFSGGGTGPMATLATGADRLSFTFPRALPRPVVSGPDATYCNVLPGVDLKLTANASGFNELLIVRTRAAAASPALRSLRLKTSSAGVTLSGTADGGAQAVNRAGVTVFHTDTAAMWDSGTRPPAATAARGSRTAAASAFAPAHLARVGVRISSHAETLIPDTALLDSPKTVFPLFIDPPWTGNPSQLKWARISSNGWNIYNSTSTANSDHPRSGLDDWPGGAGETARTYYQMTTGGSTGTTGVLGSHVTAATLYVADTWSAFSSPTAADVYQTGQPVGNGWNSTDLNWSNKPADGTKQSSATSYETSSGTVSPGTLQFDVHQAAQAAVSSNSRNITFVLQSGSETDKDYWKQYGSGGGARLTFTYYRNPDLVNGTGNPVISPAVTQSGTTYVTSASPTLKITSEDTDGEQVRNIYQIWKYSGGTETTQVGGNMNSGFATNGGPRTYTGSLANGTYAWRAEAENAAENYFSPWTGWHLFTVDTSIPAPPGVESPQFPADEVGGAYSDTGSFTFSRQGSDSVRGYIFSLDGDLASTVYSTSLPAWSNGANPVVGKAYWIPASTVPNGDAIATFAPGVVGVHRIFAKAVDVANTTSDEATYKFYAGFSTPTFVYGDQLINGYTAPDGTQVPAGSVPSSGRLFVQSDCCNVHWADGKEGVLADNTSTDPVQNGDSTTLSFYIPQTGYYDLAANLAQSFNYGTYNIVLNANAATGTPAYTLLSSYDAYSAIVATDYEDFGTPQDDNGDPVSLPQGVYSMTLTITGQDSASTGYQAGIDVLRLALMSATCPITSLSGCYNNAAITNSGNTTNGDADGSGNTYPADLLVNAGWTPGAAITINGAPMTLPSYAATGTGKVPDNIVAGGQTITIPATGYANDGNAVEFLAFATNGNIYGATGTITYAASTPGCGGSYTQDYTLSDVPGWEQNGVAARDLAAAAAFPGINNHATADDSSITTQMYAISVPLACPGLPLASITLPVVTNGVQAGEVALHVLALGIRAASYTDTTGTQDWTASFADTNDSDLGALTQTTVRMPAVISAAGTSLRIHLSNASSGHPVTFDHVTVAVQSSGPQPVTGTMTDVKFGQQASVTIPGFGEATSDPVPLATTQNQTLLVSVHITSGVTDAAGHPHAVTTGWTSTSTADEAGDTTGTTFTHPITAYYWLSGIDVTTAGNTNGTVGFWGDQTINSDTASGPPHRFTDDVAAGATAANGGTVPYGILNLGYDSTSPNDLLPVLDANQASDPMPLNAANPIDGDVLNRANLRTVLISAGTADILAGETADTVETNLQSVASEIRSYTTDTPNQNPAGFVTVYVATIPPNSAFTAAEESVREAVNQAICPSPSTGIYLIGFADGCIDFASAVSTGGTETSSTVAAADLTSTGSPNNAYYQAEANAYLNSTTLNVGPDIILSTGAMR